MRSPGAVAVVPLMFDAEGNPSVVLRAPVPAAVRARSSSRSRPACATSPASRPRRPRRRELVEEAGLAPGRLDLLDRVLPVAGHDRLGVTRSTWRPGCTRSRAALHGPEEQHSELLAPAARRRRGDGRAGRDRRRQDGDRRCCSPSGGCGRRRRRPTADGAVIGSTTTSSCRSRSRSSWSGWPPSGAGRRTRSPPTAATSRRTPRGWRAQRRRHR